MKLFTLALLLVLFTSCESEYYYPSECELNNRQVEREIRILEEQDETAQILIDIKLLRDELVNCPQYIN